MFTRITFSNGEILDISANTVIHAWKSDNRTDNEDDMYYATMIFEGSNLDGSSICTSDPIVGLQGLFGHADWFSIVDTPNKFFRTSAIVSLESID